jgi:hypothetical protein
MRQYNQGYRQEEARIYRRYWYLERSRALRANRNVTIQSGLQLYRETYIYIYIYIAGIGTRQGGVHSGQIEMRQYSKVICK